MHMSEEIALKSKKPGKIASSLAVEDINNTIHYFLQIALHSTVYICSIAPFMREEIILEKPGEIALSKHYTV